MSKAFYLTSIVGAPAAFTAATIFTNVEFFGLDPTPFRNWSMIASLYAFAIFILFWYRAWSALSDEKLKFNPAWMAIPLLIPIFSLYWLFRAVRGWPKAYNRYARERRLNVPPLDAAFFTIYCVFTVAMVFVNPGHFWKVDFYGDNLVLFFVAQAAKSAQLCLDAALIWIVCGAVNRLPAREPESGQT
jgi:hypothetical protein